MNRRHVGFRARWVPAALVVVAAACISDRPSPFQPDYAISDGAHSGGTAGFYFLPPMVRQPAFTGVFDGDVATVNPVVIICDVTTGPDVGCGPASALRVFTTASSPAITVADGQYQVNWDTKEGSFSAGRTYRVHVLGGSPSRELGFADILLTTEPGKAKSLAGGDVIVLNDGRTLPIKFRIEQGVIQPVGPARTLELAGLPPSLASGSLASVTVTARDENGNIATGYVGAIAFTSTDPAATLPDEYTFTAADAGVHTFIDAVSLATAGDVTVRVADVADAALFAEVTVTVQASAAASLAVTGLADPTVAGATGSITVMARDVHGNVATDYTGTITFTSTDPAATLPEDYTFTPADGGTHTFTAGVVLRTAGSATVTATDQAIASITGSQTVTAGPAGAALFVLTGVTDPATAGVAYDLSITAKDEFGNVATGYTGTVQFIATDPAATVPADYAFEAGDAGVKTFVAGVTLRTAGTRAVQATDAATPSITGGVLVTVQAAAASELRFTTQPTQTPEGAPIAPPVVVTAFDAFSNVATAFTGPVAIVIGANPGGGTLDGTLQVNAALGVATLNNLSISADGVGYTLVASGSGLTSATSDPFDVTAVGPTAVHWVNPAGGAWSVGTNWSTGAAPQSDQAVFIDLPGTYTVTLDVNATVYSFKVGATSGVQTLAAGGSRILGVTTTGDVQPTGRLALTGATINGPGMLSITAGAVLNLSASSTINASLSNAGTVAVFNSSVLNGSFTTAAGSMLRVQSVGFGGAALTVAGGFTNLGIIELTSTTANGVSLNVNGTLVNAATIMVIPGGGGTRTLGAQLDNQGTLNVNAGLTLSRAGADHVNSGTIVLNADLFIPNQGGTTPSFTNTGIVTVNSGRTWSINNSSFTQATGATLNGGGAMSLNAVNPAIFGSAFSLAALSVTGGSAVTFATDITTATLALSLNNSTVNGSVTLTNAATKTLTLAGTTVINSALVNAGTLVVLNSSTLNGSFSTQPGSLLRVQSIGFGGAAMNVASGGFTNHGIIEITGITTNAAALTVNGTLENAAGATIAILAGVGGARTLNAQLDNQGTLTLGAALLINRGSADHTNSGTIRLNAGNLTITQSGTTPSFTNSGLIDLVGPGAFLIGVGPFANQASGSIQGAGTFEAGISTPLSNAGSITPTLARIGNTLTGSGTFAPVTAEFFSNGTSIPAGSNYAYTNVRVLSSASFAGSEEITGNLTVAGSGNLTIGAHEVVVEGSFATQNTALLTMQNALGILNVRGNAGFGGGSTNTRLTAGRLLIGGNFTQSGGSTAAFAASTNHVTELDGPAGQTVFFANPGAATTASHFQRLVIANFDNPIVLSSAAFANGRLSVVPGQQTTISSAGLTLTVGGLSVDRLAFDNTPLRVVNGDAITQFDNVTFRNMDPAVTQLRLDRLNDAVTFNTITFETVPTTGGGLYLHLVDTDGGGAALFTVTMLGTTPASHGGMVLESVAGQLLGWPL